MYLLMSRQWSGIKWLFSISARRQIKQMLKSQFTLCDHSQWLTCLSQTIVCHPSSAACWAPQSTQTVSFLGTASRRQKTWKPHGTKPSEPAVAYIFSCDGAVQLFKSCLTSRSPLPPLREYPAFQSLCCEPRYQSDPEWVSGDRLLARGALLAWAHTALTGGHT